MSPLSPRRRRPAIDDDIRDSLLNFSWRSCAENSRGPSLILFAALHREGGHGPSPRFAALQSYSGLCTHIQQHVAAVHAALVQPWSNGQTEGQITKLKLVKRQMYGRAKIDLLQARLIGAT